MKFKTLTLYVNLLVLGILVTGCNDDVGFGTSIEADIAITYLNENNESLMATGVYDVDDMSILYKIGDEFKTQYEASSDYWFVDYFPEFNADRIVIYSKLPDQENPTTTLIKLSETEVDTIVVEYNVGKNFQNFNRLWYNGQEFGSSNITVFK